MRKTTEITIGYKSLHDILEGKRPYYLSGSNLNRADLSDANLSGADLRKANLSGSNLNRADLSDANLSGADLSRADLRKANLSGADLSRADLRKANLSGANLSEVNLSGANLSGANLSGADLSGANLSGAVGLLSAADWINENFEKDDFGVIVYKRIKSGVTEYMPCQNWVIEQGSYITETVNRIPINLCGCGVNFGTLDWCNENYQEADLWKCRIRWIDLADVVVPYNTDEKARCGKLELLEIVTAAE